MPNEQTVDNSLSIFSLQRGSCWCRDSGPLPAQRVWRGTCFIIRSRSSQAAEPIGTTLTTRPYLTRLDRYWTISLRRPCISAQAEAPK
jgi:hypothetical protein